MKVTIKSFGSSSSGNSIILNINGTSILIDAGAKDILHNDSEIKAIFISHTHIDHIRYVNRLMKNNDIFLYATIYVCNYLDKIDRKIPLDLYVRKEVVDGLFVSAFKTYHDAYGSCGFVFEKDGIKVSIVTDTGIITKEMLNSIKGSQIVIIESNHDLKMLKDGPYPFFLQERVSGQYGHLSNEQCANVCKYLANNGTKYFLLAHLSDENNKPEIALKTTNEAIKETNAEVYVLPKYEDDIHEFNIEPIIKEENQEEYNYCLLCIDKLKRKYWYLDTSKRHQVGDNVEVSFGKKETRRKATIIKIEKYCLSNIPFPLEQMKKL